MPKTTTIKKQSDKILIKTLRETAESLQVLSDNITAICNDYELPERLAQIDELIKQGKISKISTSWLQRKHKIGYAHASYIFDQLVKAKIIKPN